jgi:hypothetical protein
MPIPGSKRTITADEQNAALGIDATAPRPAPLPLTPNQARRLAEDKWCDDMETPDYEASVVSGADAVANALGLRAEDFDPVPLGSAPEGQPIPQQRRPKIKPRPEPEPEWAPQDPAAASAEADALRADYRKHAAGVAKRAAAAKGTDREARHAQEVAATVALGEALKKKLGSL